MIFSVSFVALLLLILTSISEPLPNFSDEEAVALLRSIKNVRTPSTPLLGTTAETAGKTTFNSLGVWKENLMDVVNDGNVNSLRVISQPLPNFSDKEAVALLRSIKNVRTPSTPLLGATAETAGKTAINSLGFWEENLMDVVNDGNVNSLQKFMIDNSRYFKDRSLFAMRARSEALLLALRNGKLDVVELLLKEGNANPAYQANEAIKVASANGYTDLVEKLLAQPIVMSGLKKPNSHQLYESLKNAAHYGHWDIVRLLLTKKGLEDAYIKYPYDIVRVAVEKHRFDIMELLINDKRISSALDARIFNNMVMIATREKDTRFIRYITDPSRLNRDQLNSFIINAYELEFLKSLVDAGIEIDKVTLESALKNAKSRGYVEIANYLESLKSQLTEKVAAGSLQSKSTSEASHLNANNLDSKDPFSRQNGQNSILGKTKFSLDQTSADSSSSKRVRF